jgi:hypothetical protein
MYRFSRVIKLTDGMARAPRFLALILVSPRIAAEARRSGSDHPMMRECTKLKIRSGTATRIPGD